MLSMYQQITIKTLKSQGKNNSEIARSVGVHRNTVIKSLKRGVVEKQSRIKPSSFSTYYTQIEDLLKKKVTKFRIWQILKDEHQLTPSYSAFCKYTQDHIKKEKPAYVVQEREPGEEAEVDFGFGGMFPLSVATGNGKYFKVWVFLMTLSFSRYTFYCAVTDQAIATFIQCQIDAFTFFGGVPLSVKIDNLKAGIIEHTRYTLEFNRDFLTFSSHYNFIIKPCSPFEPNQKGKVESGVGYVKKNFLPGRTFADVVDFRNQLKDWMINTANMRIHGTTKQIPTILFETHEKQTLQPLPQTPFSLTIPFVRKVKLNCHINVTNNYYLVPSKYVGELVEVRTQGNILTISSNNEEIATHAIASGEGHFITNPSHYPSDKVYSQTTYQTKFEEKMKAIGPNAHEFFKQLIAQDHLWLRVVKVILGLKEQYGAEKLDRALKRAVTFGVLKPSAIERILAENLQDQEIEPRLLSTLPPAVPVIPTEGVLGVVDATAGVLPETGTQDIPQAEIQPVSPDATFARDLSYYSALSHPKKIEQTIQSEKEHVNVDTMGTEKSAEEEQKTVQNEEEKGV